MGPDIYGGCDCACALWLRNADNEESGRKRGKREVEGGNWDFFKFPGNNNDEIDCDVFAAAQLGQGEVGCTATV